ncbi:MAG: hypothetical protein U0521_09830 [Anaerolineae bacterium]
MISSAPEVDIYLNNALAAPSLAFGEATGYIALPTGSYDLARAWNVDRPRHWHHGSRRRWSPDRADRRECGRTRRPDHRRRGQRGE